jgi:hypothetical protein
MRVNSAVGSTSPILDRSCQILTFCKKYKSRGVLGASEGSAVLVLALTPHFGAWKFPQVTLATPFTLYITSKSVSYPYFGFLRKAGHLRILPFAMPRQRGRAAT